MSAFSEDWIPYGAGRRTRIGGLHDDDLTTKMRDYRKNVAKKYRSIQPDRLSILQLDDTVWLSTKVDGELWFLVKKDGEVALCAYNGRCLQGVAVVDEAAEQLADVGDVILAGELFAVPGEGRPRVQHVATTLGDESRAGRLGFKAFDVVELDGTSWQDKAYGARMERLTEWVGEGKRCAAVATVEAQPDELAAYFQEWVSSGKFEGLIIRTPHGITYKCKPSVYLDCVVLAYGERMSVAGNEVRELNVGLLRDDGSYHLLGSVGSGLSDEDRRVWHARLQPLLVPSSFRLANREGTLCRFVRPEVVVRIKCADLLDLDSNDRAIRRMALSFDGDGYAPLSAIPFVSLLHPVLGGLVDNAVVDAKTVGVRNAYDIVPFDDVAAAAPERSSARGEVLFRRVFTKANKHGVAVRKMVAIKPPEDDRYARLALFMTDYSPGRKDPLKTDLRVASDDKRLADHVEEWLAKNVKKGWEEVVS